MPVRYVCSNCGHQLFAFERVGQDFYGVRTPSEVRNMFAGKCPKCGHGLSNIPEITIKARFRVVRHVHD